MADDLADRMMFGRLVCSLVRYSSRESSLGIAQTVHLSAGAGVM
jgi:hypothetical protein